MSDQGPPGPDQPDQPGPSPDLGSDGVDLPDYGIGKVTFKEPLGPSPLLTAIGGLVVGAVAAGLIAFGVSESGGPEPQAVASASAAPPEAPSASASLEPTALSLVARAALGEDEAVKELEARKREDRTAEETIALARAKSAAKRKDMSALKRKIGLVPKVASAKKTVKAVRGFAKDRSIAIDILEMLTTLEGSGGPDLLYKITRDWNIRSKETKGLAMDLLYSKDVRSKASPALSVVLDMKAVEDCKEAAKILKQVKLHGDKRAEGAMGRFYSKRGCGKNKVRDCWGCLRGGDLIKKAGAAAHNRPAPL